MSEPTEHQPTYGLLRTAVAERAHPTAKMLPQITMKAITETVSGASGAVCTVVLGSSAVVHFGVYAAAVSQIRAAASSKKVFAMRRPVKAQYLGPASKAATTILTKTSGCRARCETAAAAITVATAAATRGR